MCHSCIELSLSPNQSRRLSIYWIVKVSRINCHQADRPRYFEHRCTVQAETGRAENVLIFWLIVSDVVMRFCRADDLTKYLSSRALVMGWYWDITCRSVQPSATHWFRICMTVDGWMDDQCDGWYHGAIIHTLDMRRSRLHRISTFAGMHFFLFETWQDILSKLWPYKALSKWKIHCRTFLPCCASGVVSPSCIIKCAEILIICISQHLPFIRFWRSSNNSFLVFQF